MTKAQLRKLKTSLKNARDYALKAQQAEENLLREITDILYVPIGDVPTNAENANSLEEAITCFLAYGEYSMDGILDEIQNASAEQFIKETKRSAV